LTDFLLAGNAALGILISAPDTLTKVWLPLPEFKGIKTFHLFELHGTVTLSALIVSTIDSNDYRPENLNGEFGNGKFTIKIGDPLAIAEEITQEISFDRRSSSDLVTVQLNEDLDESSYVFDFSGDTLLISAGEKIMGYFELMREDPYMKPHLFQGIYKDAITAAILELCDDSDLTQTAWGRNLIRQIDKTGGLIYRDMTFDEANQIALKLVARDGIGKILLQDMGN
jgi:hypothetical protein